jgi:hypothetical protein
MGAMMEKWAPVAEAVKPSSPRTPIPVLAGEALDLYYATMVNWEPRASLPGMREALAGQLTEEATPKEIIELSFAVSHAQGLYRSANTAAVAPVERGEFLLSEMKQCLGFLFDDDVDDERDAALERLSESHSDTTSHDALAISLEGFAMFANDYREALANLPEFEADMIDEALVVAQRLREQSAIKASGVQAAEQQASLALRNGLVTLLEERVNRVRRAARFVFRNHPTVSVQFGSNYERRQRARQRAAKKAASEASAAQEQQPVAP